MKWVAWACLLFACAANVQAEDAEIARQFRIAKSSLIQQLSSGKAETRLKAVRKLAEFPLVDSAKILLGRGLASGDEIVRQATFQSLLQFKDDSEICAFLKQEVEKDLKKDHADAGTCAALGVLLASEAPEAEKVSEELLTKASSGSSGPLMLVLLVDELGLQGDEVSLNLLIKLSKLSPFTRDFGCRRALVQALVQVRRPAAVATLFDILEGVQGETRADILRHLVAISGKQLNTEVEWREWWTTNEATFKFPAKDAQPAVLVGGAGLPNYYGLPLYGAKMVFVLDTSGSMRGARIEAAKRELVKALSELPDGVQFNVVAFNVRVIPWEPQLVFASETTKRQAAIFVQKQDLGPATASYDALAAAMTFPTESIFFLTDGAPAGGKITQPAQIVDVLSKANKTRRITINCIGIGVGQERETFATFLRTLAAQNYGAYRRVDE